MLKGSLWLQPITSREVVKAIELAEQEVEINSYGIEKEFAFINAQDLSPAQRIGRQSTYKFVMTYGDIPFYIRARITPEVFDFMVETITEPKISYRQAVDEIICIEAILWQALEHILNELPNMSEILLSSGTLYKSAHIDREHITEVWGEEKRWYLEEMVKRYGEKLTPQGMHGNISLPEPLIALQYHRNGIKKRAGSIGYTGFKNEIYVWLACKLRAFASLIIAIEANSPFDYVIENDNEYTVLTGYQSNRWAKLPQIESTNYPSMLKDYEHFQTISLLLIEKTILIGANNYMPIRPKGERRLGEVPLSLERAAWFHNIVIDDIEIENDPMLVSLKGKNNLPFIEKLRLAEKLGWLDKKGYTLEEIIKVWRKDNVRRLLGIPLNRLEIRCEESGGDYSFEIAKAAFIQTLCLYLFCNPGFSANFRYSQKDLACVSYNEKQAMSQGLNAQIMHPFSRNRLSMREFLAQILQEMEKFSREIGTYDDLIPIYELAKGAKNEAEKKISALMKYLGKKPKKTRKGFIIVPAEFIISCLQERRDYVLNRLAKTLDIRTKYLDE